MSSAVIDSSVVASCCFPDERSDYALAVLDRIAGDTEAYAPRLWAYEIHNAVLMGVRRRRITMTDDREFLESLRTLHVQLVDPLFYEDLMLLAERSSLTVYDAAYLDLAVRLHCPLASFDAALCRAALAVGVPILQP